MSFLGKLDQLPKITVQKVHKQGQMADPNEQKLKKQLIKQALGSKAAAQQFKEDREAAQDRKAKRGTPCQRAGCSNIEQEGQKYSRCSKCWDSVQRSVYYYCK